MKKRFIIQTQKALKQTGLVSKSSGFDIIRAKDNLTLTRNAIQQRWDCLLRVIDNDDLLQTTKVDCILAVTYFLAFRFAGPWFFNLRMWHS